METARCPSLIIFKVWIAGDIIFERSEMETSSKLVFKQQFSGSGRMLD